jgi:putative Ca2+/H+ antiporter (TMEM165/GDT1 family)
VEWFTAGIAAFGLIVPVELPDKTFVATLVLATRYPSLPVWLGVSSAFLVQCMVAVAAGGLLSLLPELPVQIGAATLFAIGAVILIAGARKVDRNEAAQEREYAGKIGAGQSSQSGQTGWRAAGASFLVLFAAEWGDLSQLLTAGLVAAGRPAIPVLAGSWLALVLVAGVGVLLGRVLLRYVRLSMIRYVGGAVCAVLAVITVVAAIEGA